MNPASLGEAIASLVGAWWLNYWIHSTVIFAVVWLVARRRVPLEIHDTLWKFALVGALITATATTFLPGGVGPRIETAPQVATTGLHLSPPPMIPHGSLTPVLRNGAPGWESLPDHAPVPSVSSQARRVAQGVLPFAVVLWVLGAVWGTVRVARARRRIAHGLAGRREVFESEVTGTLQALRTRAGVRGEVKLSASDRLCGPVALGQGEICIPGRVLEELSVQEQESVLAHEMAHLVRRDPTWLLVGAWIEAVFFFQPLNRVARRRLQETAEYLCDDWAVRQTGRHLTLARCLAQVAGWMTHQDSHPEPAMAGIKSPLVLRVERLLSERVTAPTPRWVSGGIIAALIAGVWVCAPQAVGSRGTLHPALPETPPVLEAHVPTHDVYFAAALQAQQPIAVPLRIADEHGAVVIVGQGGKTVMAVRLNEFRRAHLQVQAELLQLRVRVMHEELARRRVELDTLRERQNQRRVRELLLESSQPRRIPASGATRSLDLKAWS